jgi:hypothetical protein
MVIEPNPALEVSARELDRKLEALVSRVTGVVRNHQENELT